MVMDDDKLKKLLQEDMEVDMENILEAVSSDPSLKDVVAPEEIHNKLFEQIREDEVERTDEENELIRLGKIYKKKRSRRKYWVLAAAVLCAFALGITSFGGAEKVFEKLERVLDGRKQTVINNDDSGEDSFSEEIATEEEAYQKIEDEFGVYPVRVLFLPEGMEFVEFVMEKELQVAQLIYENNEGKTIVYKIATQNRTSSYGTDIEDRLIKEATIEYEDCLIDIKEFEAKGNEFSRWVVEFAYKDVQYFLQIMDMEEEEMKKIVENLYFS